METIVQIVSFISLRFILGWSLFVTVSAFVYRVSTDPLSKIPGPFISKFTGILETFYYARGYRHEYVHSLHVKYGVLFLDHTRVSGSLSNSHSQQALSFGMPLGMWISQILEQYMLYTSSTKAIAKQSGTLAWHHPVCGPS